MTPNAPNVWPMPSAAALRPGAAPWKTDVAAPPLLLPLAVLLAAESPPRPVYTTPPSPPVVAPACPPADPVPLALTLTVILIILLDAVLVFTLTGSRAPQGLFERQSLAQVLSPPQLLTHWLPHSWQVKKGRVCEYWVRLGERPLEQMQA